METRKAVTDPALLKILNKNRGDVTATPALKPVTDPKLLAILNKGRKKVVEPVKASEAVESVEDLPDYAMPYTSPWEYIKSVGSAAESAGRGAVAGTVGLLGDVESLGRMAFADKDNQETTLSTSQDVKKHVDFLFGEQTSSTLSPEAMEAGQFVGNVMAPVGSIVKGGKAGINALQRTKKAVEVTKKALLDPVGKYASDLATVKLSPKGEVVKDVVGKKLVELDVNPQLVSYVTNTEKGNKPAMKEIIQRIRKGAGNKEYTRAFPPTEIIGKSVVNRLKALTGLRKNYGAKLGDVVNSELKDMTFRVADLNASFIEGVKKTFDVSLKTLDKLPKTTQGNIKELSRLVSSQGDKGVLTGKQMHSLKRILDDLRDVGAKDNMSRGVENIVGGLRKYVNTTLGEASNAYSGINSKLTTILNAESSFHKLDKTRQFTGEGDLYRMVGAKLKNIGKGESAINAEWLNSLKTLDEALGTFNIRFKDNPVMLTNFAGSAREFASINTATLLKYGDKQARGAALKAIGSASINNTFGAMNNVSNLVAAGMTKASARKAIAANEKAYAVMMSNLAK